MDKKTSFSAKAARVISTLFVPPSLTIITFFFLAFYLENEVPARLEVIAVSLTFGFIFPIAMFVYFRRQGKIIDSDASIKEERTAPFLIAAGIYALGLFVLIWLHANSIITAFWFCYISNTLLTIFINKFWKISAHAMGVAGPLGAVTYAAGMYGIFFAALLLIVGWARLKLKVHTPMQVVMGSIVGFIFTYFQIMLIINLSRG